MLRLPEPFLNVAGLGRDFGRFTAVQEVQLAVAEGEFLCLLGPSGCGKTTLLRMIAGLEAPSRGRIFQAGREVTHLPPAARDFGIVFQSYALFPNMTVAANVGYGLRGPAWPRARAEARVAELLALVGLSAQAARYPAQISGGQQQRVALARALANEPGLLLLDEPLSALDAIVRLHLRQELRGLQRRLGITTIMVTHDQEEALSLADRVAVMDRGRIMQLGTPEEVYAHPANPFVAGFVGRSTSFEAVVEGAGVRLADGTHLPALAAPDHAPGTAVRVFIRPEDVALGGAGALTGRLTGIEYLGPVCRLELHAAGLSWQAEVAPRALQGVALGAEIPLTLPPDKLMLFAPDV
ncbi:ABC transporter ATP-binding protein [Sediminicoccus rosea]|jgi:iron(III) transport system ATP-binding protein|uniref:ATP-binding cassette domain-containing protein n=1 Tax=Sediminicoccus rosea TaxID=1225128 RepID=A0ABZ0PNV0_9PROT|nr:ATP-binding cassette domain-containing protein [Sediminicoccus rosea]WPB87404.1 ATP-binding cassette domain-containing protein [Sediminicoccus rosea]